MILLNVIYDVYLNIIDIMEVNILYIYKIVLYNYLNEMHMEFSFFMTTNLKFLELLLL